MYSKENYQDLSAVNDMVFARPKDLGWIIAMTP